MLLPTHKRGGARCMCARTQLPHGMRLPPLVLVRAGALLCASSLVAHAEEEKLGTVIGIGE